MPELSEEEKQSQSPESSPPSSVAFEKTNFSPNTDSADSAGTGDEDGSGSCQNSPMSSCSEEYTTVTKPQHSTEAEDANTEFGDDKLE